MMVCVPARSIGISAEGAPPGTARSAAFDSRPAVRDGREPGHRRDVRIAERGHPRDARRLNHRLDDLQVRRHLARAAVSVVGALLERTRDDLFELRREVRRERQQRLRLDVDDLIERRRRRLARERLAAREQLVQQHAGREQIRAPVDRLVRRLFGRHVVGAPHDDADLRRPAEGQLRDAEVQDLDGPVVENAHVARLDVAVHDAVLVRERQSRAQLDDDVELLVQRERRLRVHDLLEVPAPEKLHHDERRVLFLAELVDRHDVAVLQPRDGLRLAMEAVARRGVAGEIDQHQLDRDVALEHLVVRAVQHTHPAPSDALDDVVAPDPLRLADHVAQC
jgi:hypothetical protein